MAYKTEPCLINSEGQERVKELYPFGSRVRRERIDHYSDVTHSFLSLGTFYLCCSKYLNFLFQ